LGYGARVIRGARTGCLCKGPGKGVSVFRDMGKLAVLTGPISERGMSSSTFSIGDFVGSAGGGLMRVGPGMLGRLMISSIGFRISRLTE